MAAPTPRGPLPRGQVTFLFTDIEGSTRLLRQLGPVGYEQALRTHQAQLRRAFAEHRGVEIDTQGDAFFYAFGSPEAALAAAAAGAAALAGGPIRVRMGVHTGRPRVSADGYVGEDVHLGARIAAAAHGGQILLSRATRELVTNEVSDLGEHRLKDFPTPVWIYQLGAGRFPPLRTISNTNLPRPASSFVGRQRQVDEVVSLAQDGHRLVTLTGAGGSGKTRLAIEAAARLVPEHRNGTFWIGLASVRDARLVMDTVSHTVGARGGLAEFIADRDVLLVLDNFEQVAEAAPELAALVEQCPNLAVLVTSRQVLRVRGEVEYSVSPLTDGEAVELFSARSGLKPDGTIAELCRRLDNLPLAIELAAARARILPPSQLIARLSQRLDLLTGGRDAEARQRTLRATIEWSHELLSASEHQLFARLSVFAGGWTLDSAENVCDADLETLQSLLEKSLIRQVADRFSMLETIREFAAEQLEPLGETQELHARQARWVEVLVREVEPKLHGPEQVRWLDRLDAEMGNLRAALQWALHHGDGELGGRIAASSFWFWQLRSHLGEGERWLRQAVKRSARWPAPLRARLLQGHGQLTYYSGSLVGPGVPLATAQAAGAASRLLGDAASIWRGVGGTARVEFAETLAYLAIAAGEAGDPERSNAAGHEALQVARKTGDEWTIGFVLWAVGTTMVQQTGDDRSIDRGAAILQESVGRLRRAGDHWAIAAPLFYLGVVARKRGDLVTAFDLIAEATDLMRITGDKYRLALGTRYLAGVADDMGDVESASRLRAEADLADEELGQLRAG